jgi:hypothetical protein
VTGVSSFTALGVLGSLGVFCTSVDEETAGVALAVVFVLAIVLFYNLHIEVFLSWFNS